MIVIETSLPNGSLARYHTIYKIELNIDDSYTVIVNSSASNDEGAPVLWQGSYQVTPTSPISSFSDMQDYLIADTSSIFFSGTIT